MKKTITTLALIAASSTSFALRPPPNGVDKTTICLRVASTQDQSKVAGDCDESDNNVQLRKKLKQNGCATGQVAIVTYDQLNIGKCMPAGVVQL